MRSAAVAVLVGFAVSAGPAASFGPAIDSADAAAYDDGWQDGDEGGVGWPAAYPWTFSSGPSFYAIESSTSNGDGDTNADGDVDTDGRSFALVAAGSGTAYAVRFFDASLQVGDRVAFDFDAVGVGDQFFASCSLMEYENPPQQRVAFHVAGNAANYALIADGGTIDVGLPITDEGVHVDIDVTGANTYAARIRSLATGESVSGGGNMASTGDVVAFLCAIGGGGVGTSKAYFNNVYVSEPGATAAALAAIAALAQRARRSPRA
jgi:hypothetical protein